MRYIDLLEALERLTPEQREQHVVVELGDEQQWCHVDAIQERSIDTRSIGYGQIVLHVP